MPQTSSFAPSRGGVGLGRMEALPLAYRGQSEPAELVSLKGPGLDV